MMPKQYVFQRLFTEHVLDALRAGKQVTKIAEEFRCTRAWIYLTLKMAELDIADFAWYRRPKLSPGAKVVASFLASKALRVRPIKGVTTMLRVLDEGRTPLDLAIHMVMRPRPTGPTSRIRYYGVNVKRPGYVHVAPIQGIIFVVRKEAPEGVEIAEDGRPNRNVVRISELSNIEILDVLRENIR